jgi:hypothetical protein
MPQDDMLVFPATYAIRAAVLQQRRGFGDSEFVIGQTSVEAKLANDSTHV